MKIKKIAAVCKEKHIARILDQTDGDGQIRQWISTGASAYPVECLPYITEEHLETLLDISDAQAEKMAFSHEEAPAGICFGDVCNGETLCNEKPFAVVYCGRVINVYMAGGEAWFVDFALLAPIVADHKDAELWLRRTEDGRTYFAVKAGMLCVGIVMPMDRIEDLAGMLAEAGGAYQEHGT